MAQMNYLTQCTFDFGALAQLPKVLKAHGVARPFVVTDPGLKANGLLERLLAALGRAAGGRLLRYAVQSDRTRVAQAPQRRIARPAPMGSSPSAAAPRWISRKRWA